jgi:transposase
MPRVIGIDIHWIFGEVVIWEEGVVRHFGRIDMTRTALEGFGKSLRTTDEVVIEATGNSLALSRVLTPFVSKVIIANPLQVKAIAQAHVKTDKIDAGTLASLHAAGYLPQIWTPDAATERKRRLVARRNQVVRHRTRIKNEVHSILHAHLIPKCPHADLSPPRFLCAHPRQTRPSDRRRGRGPQAHRALLASVDEERRLSLGTPGAGRQQTAGDGAAGWISTAEG